MLFIKTNGVTVAQHTIVMILIHPFIGFLGWHFRQNALLISTGNKRRGRTTRHNIRITSGIRTSWYQSTILGIFNQAGSKIILYFRPSQSPKNIQIPLCQPKGIRIIHVELHISLRIFGQCSRFIPDMNRLASPTFSIGIIRIIPIYIIYLMASQQYMPQVCIKLDLLIFRSAFHFNTAQIIIPDLSGIPTSFFKVPMLYFRV